VTAPPPVPPYPAAPGPYGQPPPLQYQAPPPPANVSSHLVQSILVTLFCCLPFGIVAIVYSSMAMSKSQAGDYHGAAAAAKNAAMWGWISFGFGLVVCLFWVFAAVAGGFR
jgi:hypothetical protein